MSGTTPFMKQLSAPKEDINTNQEKQSAGCGCEITGRCNCPPNQCTCPNCPRDEAAKQGGEKQTETKPGEETFGRKMPYVESASLDVGKPLTLGGALNFAALTQFPSESERSSVDSSLREPLNSLLEIRDCLVNRLSQGNFNAENIKACSDQLCHWEGKYQSKEGVFAESGADFSSKTSQIPKGQEILKQLLHQVRDLHSLIKQRLEQGCVKQAPSVSGPKLSGESSSLMQGAEACSQPQRGTGEVGTQTGGTGTKKAAQASELGTERY